MNGGVVVKPYLGIGDLLMVKMREVSNNLKIKKIIICLYIIKKYCTNYRVKLNSVLNLCQLLYPEAEIELSENCNIDCLERYSINKTYIYNEVFLNNTIMNNRNIEYNNYILIHTKVRMDGHIDKFMGVDLIKLNNFFKNFRTNKKIILVGERNIEENIETISHKVKCIYQNLLVLGEKNELIDLTKDVLCSGNEDFNNFLYDIKLMNNADCNIIFGIGGPFCLSYAFSQNNISYISGFSGEIIEEYIRINSSIYRDIDLFIEKINNDLSS